MDDDDPELKRFDEGLKLGVMFAIALAVVVALPLLLPVCSEMGQPEETEHYHP